jgi:hypothetical protein
MLVSQSVQHDVVLHASTEQPARDPRWATRHNCRIAAEILHHTLPQPVVCVVRDTSSSGARIELTGSRGAFSASTEKIPDHITLVMTMDRMMVECRVAWRRGSMIGVRYLAPAKIMPKKPVSRFAPPKKPEPGLLGKLFKK